MLAAYTFDDPVGSKIVRDCTVNHHDGTIGGDTSAWSFGKRNGGGCFEINGGAFVTIPQHSAWDVAGAMTVASFVRSDETPTNYVGVPWHFPGTGWEMTLDGEGRWYGQLAVDGAPFLLYELFPMGDAGGGGIAPWTHIATVYEPGVRFEIFKNGVSVSRGRLDGQDGNPLINGMPTTAPTDVRIGSIYDDAAIWKGAVDEVRIYARALGPAEIQALAAQ